MIYTTLFTLFSLAEPQTTISHVTGKALPIASTIDSGVYQHYRGDYYLIFFVSRHTETEEEEVVYQSLQGDFRVWSRPLKMFNDFVDYNGQTQPRFIKVADKNDAYKFVKDK